MLLSRDDLLKNYPRSIHDHKRDILREYLQHLFLKHLFLWPLAKKLIFIGGTSLRILHDLPRFSEDLDFDTTGISYEEFTKGIEYLIQQLEIIGIQAEVKFIKKVAYHAHIKIKNILTHYNIAPQMRPEVQEKLLIKIDVHGQWLDYVPKLLVVQKFWINSLIQTAPLSVVMAMKIFTIGERKRSKGRDYTDLKFLMDNGTKPDMKVLKQLGNIITGNNIIKYLRQVIESQDKKILIRDVQPFLFNPYDDAIEYFEHYIESYQRE